MLVLVLPVFIALQIYPNWKFKFERERLRSMEKNTEQRLHLHQPNTRVVQC